MVLWLCMTEKQHVEKKFRIRCLGAKISRGTSSIGLRAPAPGAWTAVTALTPTLLQLPVWCKLQMGTFESIIFCFIELLSSNHIFLQILDNCFVSMEVSASDTQPFKICWPCHELHLHVNRSPCLSQGINCLPNRITQSHLWRFILALGWRWGWAVLWLQFYCSYIWNVSALTFLFLKHFSVIMCSMKQR